MVYGMIKVSVSYQVIYYKFLFEKSQFFLQCNIFLVVKEVYKVCFFNSIGKAAKNILTLFP